MTLIEIAEQLTELAVEGNCPAMDVVERGLRHYKMWRDAAPSMAERELFVTIFELLIHKGESPVTYFTRFEGPDRIKNAVELISNAMKADPEFAWSWHCNIAMAIADEFRCGCGADGHATHKPDCKSEIDWMPSLELCNRAAARFMKSAFEVDVTTSPQWQSLMIKS